VDHIGLPAGRAFFRQPDCRTESIAMGRESAMLDRRSLLVSAAAIGSAMTAPASAQTLPASTPVEPDRQAPGFYRYKVGDLMVTAVTDGVAHRPVEGLVRNAEPGEVQGALDSAFLPRETITIPFTTLVIDRGGKLTLIDTGNGDSGAPTSGQWMANFRAAGFDPAAVETVIISHFHGDHINGLRLKDGTAVFPGAEVLVPEAEWAFWMDDAKMAAAPEGMKGAFQNVRRVFGPIAKDVKRFAPESEVVPNVTAVAAYGHTPGHMAFIISAGNGQLMALSDTTNHPALFVRNPDWQAVFDIDGEMARQTRRRLLDMVASERLQVAFYHAPFPATGHIARDGNGFAFVPVAWSPII